MNIVGFEVNWTNKLHRLSNCNCCPPIDHYIIHSARYVSISRPHKLQITSEFNLAAEPCLQSITEEAAIRHHITYLRFQFRSLITNMIIWMSPWALTLKVWFMTTWPVPKKSLQRVSRHICIMPPSIGCTRGIYFNHNFSFSSSCWSVDYWGEAIRRAGD